MGKRNGKPATNITFNACQSIRMSSLYLLLALSFAVSVIALVPYFVALILEPADQSWSHSRDRWGTVFYSGVAGIIACALGLGLASPGGLSIYKAAIFTLVLGLFALMFAALVWFARAMFRLNRPESTSPAADVRARDAAHRTAQTLAGASNAAGGSGQSSGATSSSGMFGPKAVAIYLVILVLVMAISPRLHFGHALAGRHPILLVILIVLTAAGFLAGFAGAISLIFAEGHEPTEADRTRYPAFVGIFPSPDYVWTRAMFRARLGGFSRIVWFDFTMRDLKAAWRLGRWRSDPHWRRVFLLVGGAVTTLLGSLFTMFIISSGAPIVVTWLLFALVWLGWGFARA